MTGIKLNAISMAKEKVFILIFSWHFKLWPCSVHIYLCFVYFIYASLPTSSHTHTSRPLRCLQNCTVLARVWGLWAKVNWTKQNWAEPKLNWNEKKRIGANANVNVNANANANPWRNVGNSTYEQNWPFVQLLCLSELAYFGMTIRWQRGHKSTRHKKGSPPIPARSLFLHWKKDKNKYKLLDVLINIYRCHPSKLLYNGDQILFADYENIWIDFSSKIFIYISVY